MAYTGSKHLISQKTKFLKVPKGFIKKLEELSESEIGNKKTVDSLNTWALSFCDKASKQFPDETISLKITSNSYVDGLYVQRVDIKNGETIKVNEVGVWLLLQARLEYFFLSAIRFILGLLFFVIFWGSLGIVPLFIFLFDGILFKIDVKKLKKLVDV